MQNSIITKNLEETENLEIRSQIVIKNMSLWKEKKWLNKTSKIKFLLKDLHFHFLTGESYLVMDAHENVNQLFKYLSGRSLDDGKRIHFDFFIDEYLIKDVQFFGRLIGFCEKENYLHRNMTPFHMFCFYHKLKNCQKPEEEANKLISILGMQSEANDKIRE